jgi:hypothetical protein
VGLKAGVVSDVIKSARALLVTPEQLKRRKTSDGNGPTGLTHTPYLPHAWQMRPSA